MARVLPIILVVALMIYALVDCAMTPRERVPRGLPKGLWLVLIILPVIGPLAWLFMSRLAGAAPYQSGRSPFNRPGGSPFGRKPKPMAPDDDESFLADLDWQARKAHYERQRKEKEAAEAARKEAERKKRREQREKEAHDDDEPSDQPNGEDS
ncbi:hypothetical protein BSZ39_06775 [Bowdeniella nasicola]|uniref:Cardiolipin synthase N-terminal domain-containing protein n=1 Tax=Bowdeniella nasicola TaxID=208480 RepID=A0A1Q5Q2J8_9ACTO|nr:PLD nuclease N-terminal domain-containing protein [Bowdeniella nasicola]OKL53945.1 hypothetical protein BSZ39_06775 [Bowdeniella nasicola]